jgi:hypothetical protein
VVVWVIVCLAVILGVVALGMDGGRLMEERRHAQDAADAAALAAADDLFLNYRLNQGADAGGTAQAAAVASAAANGYSNDGAASTITVNVPPLSGQFAGQAGYAEFVIQSNLAGSFSALFTDGPLPVRARAVARGLPADIGLLLLQPSGADALSLSGNASVQVIDAPVVVNSASALALDVSGNASIRAKYVDVAGGAAPTASIEGPVHSSAPPIADPLWSLPVPNPADYPLQSAQTLVIQSDEGPAIVLSPGVYRGGIQIVGDGAVVMSPGVYILDGGGLSVNQPGQAGSGLTGNGVLIYNTGGDAAGPITGSGNGTATLTPPADGPYQGITVFQDRTLNQLIQVGGNGDLQITGLVYAPGATVELFGNGVLLGATLGGGYIVNNMRVSGNGAVTVNRGGGRPRAPDVGLVE